MGKIASMKNANVEHPNVVLKRVQKLTNNHLQNSTIGFSRGGKSLFEEPDKFPRVHIQHMHVSCNKTHLKYASPVYDCGSQFKQFIQNCIDINMNDATMSVYYVQEYLVTWPKNLDNAEKYSIDLTGSKFIIPDNTFQMKAFMPIVNPDTWEINGTMLDKCQIERSVFYRLQNEVCFSNLFEYSEGNSMKFLVTEC